MLRCREGGKTSPWPQCMDHGQRGAGSGQQSTATEAEADCCPLPPGRWEQRKETEVLSILAHKAGTGRLTTSLFLRLLGPLQGFWGHWPHHSTVCTPVQNTQGRVGPPNALLSAKLCREGYLRTWQILLHVLEPLSRPLPCQPFLTAQVVTMPCSSRSDPWTQLPGTPSLEAPRGSASGDSAPPRLAHHLQETTESHRPPTPTVSLPCPLSCPELCDP